ncbi:MAG: hypothetical protein HY270_21775 [Deltaproteobacteria bacterium]|nr:hypothetical protein [Deltaproteobacteria bacterium]
MGEEDGVLLAVAVVVADAVLVAVATGCVAVADGGTRVAVNVGSDRATVADGMGDELAVAVGTTTVKVRVAVGAVVCVGTGLAVAVGTAPLPLLLSPQPTRNVTAAKATAACR